MKRVLSLAFCLAVFPACAFAAGSVFSAGLGFDTFNYRGQDSYLSVGLAYQRRLDEGLALELGAEFGLTAEPKFFVPFSLGLDFDFKTWEKLEFYAGFGFGPAFIICTESGPNKMSFYLGPYVQTGLRAQVHRYMKLFLQLRQDLLIGAPLWINTASRLQGGVNFSLP